MYRDNLLYDIFPDFEKYRSHVKHYWGEHTSDADKMDFLMWRILSVEHENQFLLKEIHEKINLLLGNINIRR